MVRDRDFRSFPAPILHPAALPHCVCDGCRRGICSASEGARALPLLAAPAPSQCRRFPGRLGEEPGAAPGAGRGPAAGANPPARRPARRLAGRPSKTVRHGFPVGSPLRQTNPGSLNLPGKSPLGRRAGEREGAAAGLRRPGKEAGAITTLSFFWLILTSHFNLIEPCLASRLLARRVRGLGPAAAGR